MASYEIDYSKYDHNPALKRRMALIDAKEYLGSKRFNAVEKDVIENGDKITRSGFIFQLAMFAGVQGFPAEAWADSLGLVDPPEEVASNQGDSAS